MGYVMETLCEDLVTLKAFSHLLRLNTDPAVVRMHINPFYTAWAATESTFIICNENLNGVCNCTTVYTFHWSQKRFHSEKCCWYTHKTLGAWNLYWEWWFQKICWHSLMVTASILTQSSWRKTDCGLNYTLGCLQFESQGRREFFFLWPFSVTP